MARRAFFSFHYQRDAWRAAEVRNMGLVDGNFPVSDNDWETVTRGGDAAIRRWIDGQLKGRSCTIILVGTNTANRKWVNYEICQSWNEGMGVVGIRIHGLKNDQGLTSSPGGNPFDYVTRANREKLSAIAKCYTPSGSDSRQHYAWIKQHLANAIEEAIAIRNTN